MFKAYYNKTRLRFLNDALINCKHINYYGDTNIRKTACFIGEKINFYIDMSDGVNEDLGMQEYCGRIKKIIRECNGKPFIMFKTSFSSIYSKSIIDLAEKNNGKLRELEICKKLDSLNINYKKIII